MQEIYLVEEAAERLRTNKRTVQALCKSGEIKAYKMGKAWQIPEQSLNDYVQRMIQEQAQ